MAYGLGADAKTSDQIEPATPVMSDPTGLPFGFPSVRGKKLTAAFDGGRLTSDGGVLMLAQAARRMQIGEKLGAVIPDRRDPSLRSFAEPFHAAKSWRRQRRIAARIEATRLGLDIRYVVTNITTGTPEWLYAELYCTRGQAENLIKLHKGQLASDRTSCRHPASN